MAAALGALGAIHRTRAGDHHGDPLGRDNRYNSNFKSPGKELESMLSVVAAYEGGASPIN